MIQKQRKKNRSVPIALITGASAGLGFELSKLYAEAGYGLVLVDGDAAGLAQNAEHLKARYGVTVTPIAQNLSESAAAGLISQQLAGCGLTPDVILTREGFRVYGPFFNAQLQKELHPVCREYQ